MGKDSLEKMQVGRSMHFSAFSCSSPIKKNAEAFARGGGILICIRLLDSNAKARDINKLSVFPAEKEVLLLPNFKAVVVNRREEGSFTVVDMVEQMEDVQVDY